MRWRAVLPFLALLGAACAEPEPRKLVVRNASDVECRGITVVADRFWGSDPRTWRIGEVERLAPGEETVLQEDMSRGAFSLGVVFTHPGGCVSYRSPRTSMDLDADDWPPDRVWALEIIRVGSDMEATLTLP